MNKRLFSLIYVFAVFIISGMPINAESSYQGQASWLGAKYQGTKTASGELFDMNKLTAKHATLPFGTEIKVKSIKTNQSVIVKVNDRLEADTNRIVDLSKAAAERIGLLEEGIGQVIVTNFDGNASGTNFDKAGYYQIQYGAFSSEDNARAKQTQIANNLPDLTAKVEKNNNIYKVMSNHVFLSEAQAQALLTLLGNSNAIIQEVNASDYQVNSNNNTNKTSTTVAVNTSNSSTESNTNTSTEIKQDDSAFKYQIQFGSFGKNQNAEQLKETLESKDINAQIIQQGNLHKVVSEKKFTSKLDAEDYLDLSTQDGIVIPKISNQSNTSASASTNTTPPADEDKEKTPDTQIYEYGIQFGAFGNYENAQLLQSQLKEKGIETIVYQFPDDDKKLYRVLSQSPFETKDAANQYISRYAIDKSKASILTFFKQ